MLGFSPITCVFLAIYVPLWDFLFHIFKNIYKPFCLIFCEHYESMCVQNKIQALLVSLITSILWFSHLPPSWIHYFFSQQVFSSGSFREGLYVVNLWILACLKITSFLSCHSILVSLGLPVQHNFLLEIWSIVVSYSVLLMKNLC